MVLSSLFGHRWAHQKAFWALPLALLLATLAARADLANDYLTQVWQNGDGLPQSSVTSIAQTRDGYLWMGTFNGLARFDGVRFVVFDGSSSPALPSNRIVKVLVDAHGRLWILSELGDVTLYANGRFDLARSIWSGLPEKVNELAEWDGVIYMTGRDGWLYRISGDQATRGAPLGEKEYGGSYALAVDGQGKAWLAQWKSLRRLEGNAFATVMTRSNGMGYPREMLRSARDGSIWAAGINEGLRRYRDGKLAEGPIPLPGRPSGIHDVYEDRDGQVWVATLNSGLYCHGTNGQWRVFTSTNGLSINSLRCVFQDTEGNLWVGTDGGGLDMFHRRRIEMWNMDRGLSGKVVLSVASQTDGSMWIGLSGQGLNLLKDGRVQQVSYPDLVTKFSGPSCLISDGSDGVWLSPLNDGALIHGDREHGRKYENPHARSRQYMLSLFRDRAGTIWMGDRKGLTCYRDGQFSIFSAEDGIPEVGIDAITEDRQGAHYFGTDQIGLLRLDGRKFTAFSTAAGLSDPRIWSMCIDIEDTLWVGTYGAGLARFKNGHFDSLINALPVREIDSLVTDDRGCLWAGTSRGLFQLNISELNALADKRSSSVSSRQFSSADGLDNPECTGGHQPAACKGPDGRLWFATVAGVAVVDPGHLGPEPPTPRVLIEEASVDGVPAFDGEAPAHPVIIAPGRHHLEIRYTGLDFSSSKQIQFRYRLKNLNHSWGAGDWRDAGPERVVQFEGLPPGSYEFEVAARDGAGRWGGTAATLSWKVQPAFWQTGWFLWLTFAVVVGILSGLHHAQMRNFEERQAQQAIFAGQLIESQERERKRLASELHDGLGQNLLIIKNRAALALNDAGVSPPTPQVLEEISEVASQALGEVRELSQNLRPYQLDHLGLTKALQGICRKIAQASAIAVTCDIAPMDGLFSPEQQISIYRIVQEALNNMVKHSDAARGCVTMQREDGKVTLRIEDNGKGFDPGSRPLRADGGLGMTSITERVRMLGGQIEVQSAPARGTRLNIELPV